MTRHEHERYGITVHVPAAVGDHNDDPRTVKVKTGGVVVLSFPLTPENIAQVRGADRDGIATSARVWDVIAGALHRYTTNADRLLPDGVDYR